MLPKTSNGQDLFQSDYDIPVPGGVKHQVYSHLKDSPRQQNDKNVTEPDCRSESELKSSLIKDVSRNRPENNEV